MRAFTSGRTGIGHGKFMKAVVGVICAFAMLVSGMVVANTANALDHAFKGVQDISIQRDSAYAITDDGSVWVWGSNEKFNHGCLNENGGTMPYKTEADCTEHGGIFQPIGNLGVLDDIPGQVTRPKKVPGISDVKSAAAMNGYVFAVKKDGSLWGWGDGQNGMPGNGIKDDQAIVAPTPIPGMTDVKQVVVWNYSVFAVKNDGTLWTWGSDPYGILGLGDATADMSSVVPSPTKVNLQNVKRVDISRNNAVWAITGDGDVYGWGDAQHLGINNWRQPPLRSPVKIEALSGIGVSQIVDDSIVVALTDDGKVLAWDGAKSDSHPVYAAPTVVQGLSDADKVAVGDYTAYVVRHDGTLLSWDGRTKYVDKPDGSGSLAQKNAPVTVMHDVSDFYKGYYVSFAVKTDGTLWAWETNDRGQLGIGKIEATETPVKVDIAPGIASVKTLSDGLTGQWAIYQSYFIKTDGSLWVTGDSPWGFGYAPDDFAHSRYYTPQQLAYPGGEPDPDFKVTASLSFIGEQAWFKCGDMCRDKPTTGDMGEYIGLKLPMELSVTVNRPDGNSTPVSVNSAVVELPDGLSFDKSKKVRSKDVKDLLQTHMGTDTPQGWAQKIASFDVYIQNAFTYVPEFTASGTVKTSVGERHVSASIPVKTVGDDYSLVRLVQSWYEDKDLAAQLEFLSDENWPGPWYNRLTLASRQMGMSGVFEGWKYLDQAAQNDLTHAVFKDQKEAEDLLYALLGKMNDELDGQANKEAVTEFGEYVSEQAKQLIGESDDPKDVDFYSVISDFFGTASTSADFADIPSSINEWVGEARTDFVKKQVDALPPNSTQKLIEETRKTAGQTFDAGFPKLVKTQQLVEKYIGNTKVFNNASEALAVASRFTAIMKDTKSTMDTWDMIRQIRTMSDRNELYVEILESIAVNASSETVREAAKNVADSINAKTDHNVSDILTKLGQVATNVGSFAELLTVVTSNSTYLAVANLTAEVMMQTLLKSTVDSAATARTMSLQTDIAYGLEKYYHASLKAFDDPADPDVKLQRAKKVFYSLFMLLNVHQGGEENVSQKFIWSNKVVDSTTDKDGKPKDLTIKDQAAKNVETLQEILDQHVTLSARRSPTADEMYEWYATFMCPVDVDVYRNGKLLATLTAKDQTVDKDGDRFVSYTVDGDPKKLMILHGRPDEYSFKARGTDDGTLVFATDVQSGGKRVTRRTSHLQVSKGASFTVGTVDVDGTYTVDVDQNGDGTVDSQVGSVQVQSDKVTVPTGISLSQKSLSLKAGETGSVGVTLDPAGATLDGVTWSSNDPSVASVDVNGRITGVKEGTATITATTFSKISATLTVTVGKGETKPDPRKDLQQAIADAKKLDSSKYTPDSWKKLQDAIGKAETVVKDDKASVQKLAEAKSDLDAALKGLVENGSSQPSTPSQPTYRDGLVVVSKPNKLEYRIGEQFDGTGMVIKRQLADGSSYVLGPDQYTVSLDTSKPGKVKAYVTLDGDPSKTVSFEVTVAVSDVRVHRLYNAHSGEHFYTAGDVEYQTLVKAGWHDEGIGFTMADYGTPVYRLYRPGGKHLFTTSETERDVLKANKWLYEGVAFYVPENAKSSVYRLYNPGNGDHLLTTNTNERGVAILHRWHDESVGFQAK